MCKQFQSKPMTFRKHANIMAVSKQFLRSNILYVVGLKKLPASEIFYWMNDNSTLAYYPITKNLG